MERIQDVIRDKLLERFLRYVRIDTQSQYQTGCYPSTSKQFDLLHLLYDELQALGAQEVELDEYGYLMASIPASLGCEDCPVVGLIAHVDTSPDMSGAHVRPQVILHYDGGDIRLMGSGDILSPRDFPELKSMLGHTLITTDGTTLLGADDKAGVAEIMTVVDFLLNNKAYLHGKVRIAFTVDEEIGHGVDHFDLKRFAADYAYTLDGSAEGELEYECFNAASVILIAKGRNVHPGYAKGKMINALQILCDLHNLLPIQECPEYTEGYEGFYHLTQMTGTVDEARSHYIVRDHDRWIFEGRKTKLKYLTERINKSYGVEVLELYIEDQYYNMKEQIEPHLHIVNLASEAMRKAGVNPIIRPIRGGTDGARLSYMGLPCPNIFAGGMNFHGRYEYASLQTMSRTVETVVHLLGLFTQYK